MRTSVPALCIGTLFGLLVYAPAHAQDADTTAGKAPVSPGDAILGFWYTSNGPAKVEVTRCEDKYCGKIVWLETPEVDGKPVLDANNADEDLRSRPILGVPVLTGYVYDASKQQWDGGVAYSPERGHEYNAILTMDGEKLKITVKLGPAHKSEEWTRTTAPEAEEKDEKQGMEEKSSDG